MRKALLQRLVTEAAAGSDSPVGCSACAPAVGTPDTWPADGQQLQRVVAVDTPVGFLGSERSSDDGAGPAALPMDVECEHRLCRDNFVNQGEQDTSPVASAADVRQADSSAGHLSSAEDAGARVAWPEVLPCARGHRPGSRGTEARPAARGV